MTTIARKATTDRDGLTQMHGAPVSPLVDHRRVNGLFAEYKKTQSPATKTQIISQICAALSMTGHGEEDIFFPKVKMVLKDGEWILEAMAENAGLKTLIAQIERSDPNSAALDGKIDALSEFMKRRVEQEQTATTPAANAIRQAMQRLGSSNATRKQSVLAALGQTAQSKIK